MPSDGAPSVRSHATGRFTTFATITPTTSELVLPIAWRYARAVMRSRNGASEKRRAWR
jgi:hypothetical protein